MAKIVDKQGKLFLEIPKVCSYCNKITVEEEPILPPKSRSGRMNYDNYPVTNCGNCGAEL